MALPDTRAHYFSAHWTYDSPARPAVHGFGTSADGRVRFATVLSARTGAQSVAGSGLAHADAPLAPGERMTVG